MRLSNLFIVLFIFSTCCGSAQSKVFPVSVGEWKFTQFADNIIKASFKPANYTTNENISDAVILKPLNKITTVIKINDNAATIGNDKKIVLTPLKMNEYNGFNITLNLAEQIYGGGERALPLNRRGYKFNLYNIPHYGYGENTEDLNYSVPFFTSSNGYGLFFDNASKGYADIGKANNKIFEVGFVSGELNVYIIFGKDTKQILSDYYKLTGTQPCRHDGL